jgi:hypothetical protein
MMTGVFQVVARITRSMNYVAPVGEKEEYIARAMRNIKPYLNRQPAAV